MPGDGFMRVLKVDLSTGTCEIDEREDLYRYLGGVGLASRLLAELVHPDKDPLHPDQPLVFAIGPLTFIYPVVTKTCLMFRSPLTGELGECYAGGRLALALRFAGYDALVITGSSPCPVYLSIGPRHVHIKPAEPLWGTSTEECGRYLREATPGRGLRSIVRIGQAGEKMVRFAGLNVDTYRHFGRLGAGAVFGSKNLKAVVVIGDRDFPIPPEYFKQYDEVYRELYERVIATDAMKKYHDLGTPVNVMVLNEAGGLPTRNLQEARFEHAQTLSGEAFAEESLVRQVACAGCPIGCIHLGMMRRRFGELHEWESTVLSYDHEPIFALGTFLGMDTREKFFALLEKVEAYALDAMSTGVLLGWVTEAFSRNLITEQELGTRPQFGDVEGYLKVIDGIVAQKNELYQALARGTEYAASRYGGQDFAMCLGGNEMTGYHTGYGAVLGQAVGARHSHLDNAGYSFDQTEEDQESDALVKDIYDEERARCIMNSLVICLFARKVYDFETTVKALAAIGIKHTEESLWQLADEIYYLKLDIKEKLGFRFENLRFPKRFFETPSKNGELVPEIMDYMLGQYLRLIDQGRARLKTGNEAAKDARCEQPGG